MIITLKGYGAETVFMCSRPKQDHTPLNLSTSFPHHLKKKKSVVSRFCQNADPGEKAVAAPQRWSVSRRHPEFF